MKAHKIAIAALGGLLFASAAAYAAPDGPGRSGKHRAGPARAEASFVQLLKLADADKDGKVTKDEADAGFLKIFDAIDADKDGSITPGELRAYRKARIEAFAKSNPPPAGEARDADAAQDKAEARPDGERRGPPHHRDGPRHHHAGKGEGHRHHAGRHGEGRPMKAGFLLRKADTDENGQVSREEALKLGSDVFARLDVNKDGVISIDDVPDRPFP